MAYKDYEIVIGLEVHSELKTKSKIYCTCTTAFGGDPNTHCCPICTGMPGTLPVLNGMVVEYAIKAGLATNCKIHQFSKQDRKNYFYPDLPKAYQTSQYDLPLCYEGYVDIEMNEEEKRIGLTRIHIEEDAGKLIHEANGTFVDYNRCGVPLIEIVTEPDLRSPEEIRVFLSKLRSILLYADVSDCRMNEGSFRCDVNLSVRKKGATTLGTRTEMKNINSFNFAVKAAEYEAKRQIKLIESGGSVVQETRRWDEAKGVTISMRSKEEAHDYRYFPAPDLMPIVTSDEEIERIRQTIPELPDVRMKRYMEKDGLSLYDSELLVASMKISDYFDQACKQTKNKKVLANIIISEVFSRMNEDEKELGEIPISAENLGKLAHLVDANVISSSIAKKVFAIMWEQDDDPEIIVDKEGLKQISDDGALRQMAEEVIAKNDKVVQDYLSGKEAAIQALMGQMMARTKGKANPKMVIDLLKEILNTKK
jgi:aspartyl-tRNA(Asn)/glutamyl-tRNA(Gln) amidotransferase subunit B